LGPILNGVCSLYHMAIKGGLRPSPVNRGKGPSKPAAALDCRRGVIIASQCAASRGGKTTRRERPEMLSLETKKPAELVRRGARRAKAVGGVAVVAITDRPRAKQHLLRRHFHQRPDNAVNTRPRFLRAGVEPVAARQIHQRVDVTAEVGPLAR